MSILWSAQRMPGAGMSAQGVGALVSLTPRLTSGGDENATYGAPARVCECPAASGSAQRSSRRKCALRRSTRRLGRKLRQKLFVKKNGRVRTDDRVELRPVLQLHAAERTLPVLQLLEPLLELPLLRTYLLLFQRKSLGSPAGRPGHREHRLPPRVSGRCPSSERVRRNL